MFSSRIKTLASLIDTGSTVLDIGTDHAYLPIYLVKEKICDKVIGSDISIKVLDGAIKNVKEHGLDEMIKITLSDGLDGIIDTYDTLVIAGMGFNTIKRILDNKELVDKIIVQSNSDHYALRVYMMKHGYKIKEEVTLLDKNIYYVIISYIKGTEKLSDRYLNFGKSSNLEYYEYMKNKYKLLLAKLPTIKKIEYKYKLKLLDKLIKENRV